MITLRRGAVAIGAALLCVVSLASAPAFAAATSTIVGVGSSRCLDVNGNVQTPGTGVIIYDCNGGPNQAWDFTTAGELRVFGGTRCLDVKAPSTSPGAVVQIYTCNGGANQQWRVNTNGTITSPQFGQCLDVSGATTANLSKVQMWPCNGQTNQKWTSTFANRDAQAPSVPDR